VNRVGWDAVVVLIIVLIGGFFAGAEMALVSLREGQVRSLTQRGKRGQRAARLAQDPNRFLSAVQIGVTVAGSTATPPANAQNQLQQLKSTFGLVWHIDQ